MSEMWWGDVSRVEVNWSEDPIILAAELTQLARNLEEDFDHPAVAARQVIMDDVQEHFEKEQAPDGIQWDPWAPSYAPIAERENIGILRKTEDLYDAVMNPTSWPIIGNDIWVNTNAWPDYWRIHQQGGLINTPKMFARRFRKKTSDEKKAYGKIPERPYIGISDDADDVIFGIYNYWFQGTLRIVYSKMTGLAQFRMLSGTIGKRIGLRN